MSQTAIVDKGVVRKTPRILRVYALVALLMTTVVGPTVLESADRKEETGDSDAEGFPYRYPVVECGQESRTVFWEVDSLRDATVKSANTMGGIIPFGTRRIIYAIVDMQDRANPQSQADTDLMMSRIEDYWERMSRGQLDIEMTAAGRINLPFDGVGKCNGGDWADVLYDEMRSRFDLYQYDGHVYMFPGEHSCSVWGSATTGGNSEFPIYTGGFANTAWVMNPFSEFVIAHEMGHNFGLLHASTPDSSQQSGDEYGDRSSVMGYYNFDFPEFWRELRGLHGVNLAWLGWLDPFLEMKNGVFTLFASESLAAPGPQVLAIPHPGYANTSTPPAFFLSYRNGSDGTMPDGSLAPLAEEYTRGVGLRLSELSRSRRSYLYRVLEDGERYLFTDPDHELHGFFSVYQISHDDEKVTFEVEFIPHPSEESLAAGTCNNGTDDDRDGNMDFGGGLDWADGSDRWPEGAACMMTWQSIAAPASVVIGSEFFVVCESESPQVEGFGPMGDGWIDTMREPSGRYIGLFSASACGENTFDCGTDARRAFVRDHLETTVEITCLPGRFCEDGACVTHPSPPSSSSVD